MNTKVEKKLEKISSLVAKALKQGESIPCDLKLQIEAVLIKAAEKGRKELIKKDQIIKQQLNEIANLNLVVASQKALLKDAKVELDKWNLNIEGYDRYTYAPIELGMFNALPAEFDLDELHYIGSTKFGQVEGARLGNLHFYKRFFLVSEVSPGRYRKLIDKVPTDLNELAHIKDRVTLPLED